MTLGWALIMVAAVYAYIAALLSFVTFISKKHPTPFEKRNGLTKTGYRSATAQASKEVWDYAQKIAPAYTFQTVRILLAMCVVVLFLRILLPSSISDSTKYSFIVIPILAACAIAVFSSLTIRIESQLKKKLKESNVTNKKEDYEENGNNEK